MTNKLLIVILCVICIGVGVVSSHISLLSQQVPYTVFDKITYELEINFLKMMVSIGDNVFYGIKPTLLVIPNNDGLECKIIVYENLDDRKLKTIDIISSFLESVFEDLRDSIAAELSNKSISDLKIKIFIDPNINQEQGETNGE